MQKTLCSRRSRDTFFCKNFIEVWSIYTVTLTSAIQQSDSVIHTSICFHIAFHYSLSQDIGYSSLFIHPICNSLHLLIPNSQSCPPPPLPPWQPQVCSLLTDTILKETPTPHTHTKGNQGKSMCNKPGGLFPIVAIVRVMKS